MYGPWKPSATHQTRLDLSDWTLRCWLLRC